MSDGRRNVSDVSRRCLVRVVVGKNLCLPGRLFSGSNLCAKEARARKVVCLFVWRIWGPAKHSKGYGCLILRGRKCVLARDASGQLHLVSEHSGHSFL